jgi:hypothetical protein
MPILSISVDRLCGLPWAEQTEVPRKYHCNIAQMGTNSILDLAK